MTLTDSATSAGPPADATPFGSDRIAHLLAEARAQFLAHGYEHLSVDGLARASGVSKETIYRYFTDKAAIFRAAVERLDNPLQARLPPLDPQADPQTVLAGCVRVIHDSTADEHASFMWIAVAMVRDFPDLAAALNADGLSVLEPIRRYLEAVAERAGRPQPVSMDTAALLGSLAIEGPRYLMGWPPQAFAEREAAARRVARLFLAGCLSGDRDADPGPCAAEGATGRAREYDPHLQALLQEARGQFYARGFRGANLDEIGAAARVGRGTLYRHFGSKAGLFDAAMIHAADELAAQVLAPPPQGGLALRLQATALQAAEVLCSPDAVRLYRTVISESRRAPETARQVYLRTRTPLSAPVAAWLEAAARRGDVVLDDVEWAASQFLTLAVGGNRHLTSGFSSIGADRQRLAQGAVETFLHGYLGRA